MDKFERAVIWILAAVGIAMLYLAAVVGIGGAASVLFGVPLAETIASWFLMVAVSSAICGLSMLARICALSLREARLKRIAEAEMIPAARVVREVRR